MHGSEAESVVMSASGAPVMMEIPPHLICLAATPNALLQGRNIAAPPGRLDGGNTGERARLSKHCSTAVADGRMVAARRAKATVAKNCLGDGRLGNH